MSIPRNHHHVSICQIQNFWNNEENNIWLYDKELNNFYSKKTAKSIFSERDSNSRIYNDVLEHCTLENELRDFYETPFTPCYKRLESIVLGLTNDKKDLKNDLMSLARYGIAGLLRPPSKKKETDDALKNILFKELYELSSDELKEQINEMRNSVFGSKYSNTLNYKDFVDSVLKKMGDLFFEIYLIQTDNLFFLLPDKPSFGVREKINVYFNPDINEYAKIGIPLSSKIFLHVESKKLRNENDKVFFISKSNINFLNQLNSSIFNLADKTVACESEVYLRSFIKNL